MAISKPVKKFVLNRDEFKCRKCQSKDKLQLHHVLPQRLQGPDDSFNLVALCAKCHSEWHSIETKLGINFMEKRVVEAFYIWLKEEKNASIFLENVKLYNSIKKAQLKIKRKA